MRLAPHAHLFPPSPQARAPTRSLSSWDFRPQWSPDGALLVFIRVPYVGATSELWAMDADGSNARMVTAGEKGRGVDHARFLPYGGLDAGSRL